jgi:hypothetical protein
VADLEGTGAAAVKVFSNDMDTFIAADRADLAAAYAEYLGQTNALPDDLAWRELPDDHKISIWCNAAGVPDEPDAPGAKVVTKTALEWAAGRPRGMLCSTEF